jgi:ankyrin repeat protein
LRFVEACAGADVKAQDNSGSTAVILASINGHEAVPRLLIEKGADVKAQDNSRCVPFPFLFYYNGAVIRLRCKFAAESEAFMHKMQRPAISAQEDA